MTLPIYRERGGYNRNPTARTFNGLFKSNTLITLMKPPEQSNSENDENINLFGRETPRPINTDHQIDNEFITTDSDGTSSQNSSTEETILETTPYYILPNIW